MNLISKTVGAVAFIVMIIGLFPLLGWLNWVAIPIALIGLFLGIFARKSGGLALNGIVLVVSFIRLIVGGGIV